ncbi:hypothetical protein JN11_03378 [Mucilaginibacter frigoritolerans]|uniref:Uncharacterized protein n=1 Tax=Mucilaginibacter frigoritolerans TaxID=652788 RepID=A0A562TW93_9SPHI|nr:hypothetical protein JN11_03378 [Mucilaginibacter frigoritolerans]
MMRHTKKGDTYHIGKYVKIRISIGLKSDIQGGQQARMLIVNTSSNYLHNKRDSPQYHAVIQYLSWISFLTHQYPQPFFDRLISINFKVRYNRIMINQLLIINHIRDACIR